MVGEGDGILEIVCGWSTKGRGSSPDTWIWDISAQAWVNSLNKIDPFPICICDDQHFTLIDQKWSDHVDWSTLLFSQLQTTRSIEEGITGCHTGCYLSGGNQRIIQIKTTNSFHLSISWTLFQGLRLCPIFLRLTKRDEMKLRAWKRRKGRKRRWKASLFNLCEIALDAVNFHAKEMAHNTQEVRWRLIDESNRKWWDPGQDFRVLWSPCPTSTTASHIVIRLLVSFSFLLLKMFFLTPFLFF